MKLTFEEASLQFQLAASVAEFAEILRESYWAQEGSLDAVLQNIEKIQPNFANEQVEELVSMLHQSIRLRTSSSIERL